MRSLGARYTSPHQHDDSVGRKDGPVTVIVTRKAKKGKIKEFEDWMDGITHEAMKFEGHMGVNVIRPADALLNPEYVIIFRFNTYENLAKWEKSVIRNEWLNKSREVTEGEPKVEKQTGLEFWFTPSSVAGTTSGNDASAQVSPPRYKMAIVLTGMIFVLVSSLLALVRAATVDLPVLLSTFVGVIVMVLLMTYVIMPIVTRLLRPWLSKKKLF